jgi:DNA-binding NtrC family response regulator
MIRVQLDVSDLANRLTLKLALEQAGHAVQEDSGDTVITDDATRALQHARFRPTLFLCPLPDIPNAVSLMRQGVYGYMVVPLQPGEADIMVRRAAALHAPESTGDAKLVPLEDIEREHILAVLRQSRGNRAQAARILKIGRNTLWRKLKKWGHAKDGDDRDDRDPPDPV